MGLSSWRMWQRVTGLRPLAPIKLTLWLLADCGDQARGPSGQLESDHCRMRLTLQGDRDYTEERTWAELKTHFDYPNNTRAWNKIVLIGKTNSAGNVVVELSGQQNWADDPTGVAWFIQSFELDYLDDAPIPDPDDTAIVIQPGQLSAMRGAVDSMLDKGRILHSSLDMFLAELRDYANMLAKMAGE